MPPPAEQWGGSALITVCACAYSKGGHHERLQVILLMRLNNIFTRDMWRSSFAIQQMLVYVNSLSSRIMESWNHRRLWVGGDLKDHLVATPCLGQEHLTSDQAFWAASTRC